MISNPVASELILPTVRTRRGAVSRKLIGRWLHLSSRKIDYFGVGKRPECGVQSCLQSEGILSGVKPWLQSYGDIASNAVAGAPRARRPATLAGLKLRDAQLGVHSTARRATAPICAFNLSPDGVHRAIDRTIPMFLYCHLIMFFSYVILLTIG